LTGGRQIPRSFYWFTY